eukprot:SAG31_NODE_32497_length_355_cov_0.792969_1_plen_44_part_01
MGNANDGSHRLSERVEGHRHAKLEQGGLFGPIEISLASAQFAWQ